MRPLLASLLRRAADRIDPPVYSSARIVEYRTVDGGTGRVTLTGDDGISESEYRLRVLGEVN